jgi:hypothetical protein
MKDFISKPIQIIELERLFEKWILQPKLNYWKFIYFNLLIINFLLYLLKCFY